MTKTSFLWLQWFYIIVAITYKLLKRKNTIRFYFIVIQNFIKAFLIKLRLLIKNNLLSLKQKNMALIKKEVRALGFALKGIKAFLIKEEHAKVHLLATLIVLPISIVLPTNTLEKAAIFIVIALVWATEMCNSAIEKSLDILVPNYNKDVAYVKDVMAGAVLVSSICSVAIGIIIIVPKIYAYVF